MKRQSLTRKPVLNLETDKSNNLLHRNWQTKYQQITDKHKNRIITDELQHPLNNLLGSRDSDNSKNKMDAKVNDFLKEIGEYSTDEPKPVAPPILQNKNIKSGTAWQECYDETTGYPYYWNTETNAVTWEMPSEYKTASNVQPSALVNLPAPSLQLPSKKLDSRSKAIMQQQKIKPPNDNPRKRTRNDKESFKKYDVKKGWKRYTSDSEDEKIEMITSYGEESESEEEDNIKKLKASFPLKPVKAPLPEPRSGLLNVPIGPAVIYKIQPEPQVIYPKSLATKPLKPEILDYNLKPPPSSELQINIQENSRKITAPDCEPEVDDSIILSRLRTQAKVLQELGGELPQEIKQLIKPEEQIVNLPKVENEPVEILKKDKKDISSLAFSLVAGYGDDSDAEDDESESPVKRGTLFPISEKQTSIDKPPNTLFPVVLSVESTLPTITDSVQDQQIKEMKNKPVSNSYVDGQNSDELIDTKAFKRKRRIALDILPTQAPSKPEIPVQYGQYLDPVHTERKGFGFQQNPTDIGSTENTEVVNKYKSPISFIKAETINVNKQDASDKKELETLDDKSTNEEIIKNLDDVTEVLNQKLEFLSEGKEPVSAVQALTIQLQTLLEARKADGLTNRYLQLWLKNTASELEKLERDAAPAGWKCQWDRSNKRYFYQNLQTGVTQWQYPDADIIGGAEAMDICTTPPPIEDVEHIQEEPELKKDVSVPLPPSISPPQTPPPPQISSPSPPPPPIISSSPPVEPKEVDDKDKSHLDILPPLPPLPPPTEKNPPPLPASPPPPPAPIVVQLHGEPLPPGIDPPELPYIVARPREVKREIVVPADVASTQVNCNEAAALSNQSIYGQTVYQSALGLNTTISVNQPVQLNYPAYNTNVMTQSQSTSNDPAKLGSELESFYSDIASLETNKVEPKPDQIHVSDKIVPVVDSQEATTEVKKKKKAKTKIASGLTLKKKGVSSLVEKWKKVQKDYKED